MLSKIGQGDKLTALGAADWLCLAAAPTFAIMALLAGVLGDGEPDPLCSASQHASPLGGMAAMYLLMCAFHSAPWLKLISGPRSGGDRTASGTCTSGSIALPGDVTKSVPGGADPTSTTVS